MNFGNFVILIIGTVILINVVVQCQDEHVLRKRFSSLPKFNFGLHLEVSNGELDNRNISQPRLAKRFSKLPAFGVIQMNTNDLISPVYRKPLNDMDKIRGNLIKCLNKDSIFAHYMIYFDESKEDRPRSVYYQVNGDENEAYADLTFADLDSIDAQKCTQEGLGPYGTIQTVIVRLMQCSLGKAPRQLTVAIMLNCLYD